ncbi:MAG: FtsX-like permease family protein [Firmicutes bacterium]|nr:FtsX-like permease family protein [Bacillota bacterium]
MKNKSIYRTMAVQNIKKNRKMYLPYILTFVGMAAMYYIITSLASNPTLANMKRGAHTSVVMLGFGTWIVAIFALIFLFYTNSFLIKRRKKELGLYNILGMEKRHVSRILMWENLFVLAAGLGGGLLLGALFDRLIFMVLLKMLGEAVPVEFYFSWTSLIYTTLLFSAITLLIHLNSIRQVHFSNAVDLLKGGNVGEKEPKTKIITAILGAVSLGAGYLIALTTEKPIEAFGNFFIAVILVIIGTYLLFTAGSIALLKLLRKNKKYYYKPSHFISISGMIYRMKQNAVGLANICILCSAVIVTVSSTVALRICAGDSIRSHYPYDMITSLNMDFDDENQTDTFSDEAIAILNESVDDAMSKLNLKMGESIQFTTLEFWSEQKGDMIATDNLKNPVKLCILTLDDYNNINNSSETLDENEVLYYPAGYRYNASTLRLFDRKYKVAKIIEKMPAIAAGDYAGDISIVLVVRDKDEFSSLYQIIKQKYEYSESGLILNLLYKYYFNIDGGDKESRIALPEEFAHILSDKMYSYEGISFGYSYGGYDRAMDEEISAISGILFVGLFLGILFLTATVLIIYYKQITEGHEDFSRYQIMQKVGLTPREIKSSINSQVMTVFFLPLITAVIHMCFAYPVINKLLILLGLTDTNLFLVCIAVSTLIFAVIYTIIYFVTSRIYYGIVTQKNDY